MGSRMAASLLAAGFNVSIWNRDPAKAAPLTEKGATLAATPQAAAKHADIVISMVRDDEASAYVWHDARVGALAAMTEGATAIESSTLSLAATRALSRAMAERGVQFLDAPVIGSRPQAEARQLIHLVGGDAQALHKAEPALKAIGAAIHHVGPSGAGMAMKLAVNALFATQVAAAAEMLRLLERTGVSMKQAAEIIGATPVASPSAKGAMASMAAANFAPLFPVSLAAKDLAYAGRAAHDNGVQTPVTDTVSRVFDRANQAALGAEHLTAIVKLTAK